QAEREPHAVEPEPGDRPGEPDAAGTLKAGHHAVVLVRAVPVHPGQPDPPPVRVDEVAAAGGQRRLHRSGGHPGGRRARAAMCGGRGIPGGSTGSGTWVTVTHTVACGAETRLRLATEPCRYSVSPSSPYTVGTTIG